MLSQQDNEALKWLYRRLHDAPLDVVRPEDVELYEPIYKPTPEHDEPIELIAKHIYFNELESTQFFSGFRGSGKTTEMLRLKQRLQQEDYLVLYADALNYINPTGVIDISDFLISLGGAFSDAFQDPAILGEKLRVESFWDRIAHYVRQTRLDVDIGLRAGADIKIALRSSPSFRERLQAAMSTHIGSLKLQLDKFIEEGVRKIWEYQGDSKRIVFLFDSLEQIRGAGSNEKDVLQSVESLFGNHLDKLRLPSLHSVYTVPPWLKYILPGVGQIEILPSVRLWNNDTDRSLYEPGMTSMRSLVLRRLGEEGRLRLFGPDWEPIDRLISSCGGHLRDLLRLLGQVILRARALPVSSETIDRAIATVRSQYLPVAVEDAAWLERIARYRRAELQSTDDIGKLMRFLDFHMVLYLVNGGEWYDIHPLIRDEVHALAASRRGEGGEANSEHDRS